MKRATGLLSVVVLVIGCGGATPKESVPSASTGEPGADAAGSSTAAREAAPPAPDVDPLDAQKAYAKEADAAWAAHDAKRFMALYAPSATIAEPGPEGWKEKKVAEMEKELSTLFRAFPDSKLVTTRLVANGATAVAEWTLTGTHKGEFLGAKATGKAIGYRGASLLVFDKKGKVQREHLYMDHATMLGQLGLVPKGPKVRAAEASPTLPVDVVAGKQGDGKAVVDLLKKLYAAGEKKDTKAYGELLAKEFVLSNAYDPTDAKKAVVLQQMPMMNQAFPDPKWKVGTCVAAGELAACEIEWTATWKAPAMGMKATGKTGTVHALEVARAKDGKLLHLSGYGSGAEFAHAFGIATEPPKGSDKDKPKDPPQGSGKDKPKGAG